MIKVFVAIPKRAEISEAEFHAHWREPHARLALHIKPMRRYVQAHRVPYSMAGWPSCPFDGFAEVWLDDLQTALGLGQDPDYQHHLVPDEPKFCDVAGLQFIFTVEDVALEGPKFAREDTAFKLLQFVRRRNTVSSAAFREQWARASAEKSLVHSLGAIRHVCCRVAPGTESASGHGYDGIRELWWPSIASFEAARTRKPLACQRLLGCPTIADPAAMLLVPVEEYRVLWPERPHKHLTPGPSATQ